MGARSRRYAEPFPVEAPFALPAGWDWVSISALAFLDVGSRFKSAQFADQGVRLLRGENVEPGRLRWNDTRLWPKSQIEPDRHHVVEAGEIILALDRPLVSAGLKIARVYESDLPALLVQRVMRFRMVDKTDTDFLYLCLQDKRFIRFIAHEGMTGTDLPHVTGTGVAEFPVPLPPRAEQIEIVGRVDALFALADTIERRLRAATARADQLPQAILSKAFSGELVATEAELARREGRTYQTAADLLSSASVLKDVIALGQ
jgi:type I restriction enzyme S subunit